MGSGMIMLRKALREDGRLIHALVREAHINPFSLDWRRFLLAVDETGAVAGCIQVKRHADGTREMASLVVVPAHRGAGIARVLVEAIQAGYPRPLYLTCRSQLQPFYRRFGFRALQKTEMPPYFLRLRRFFEVLRFFLRFNEELTVMVWDEASEPDLLAANSLELTKIP